MVDEKPELKPEYTGFFQGPAWSLFSLETPNPDEPVIAWYPRFIY